MKKLIVACGSGVATSQTVASKVERLLKEANVPCEIEAVDIFQSSKQKRTMEFQYLTELHF